MNFVQESQLATNFNREGLTQLEMRTLLHEFGHLLHGKREHSLVIK